MTRTLGAASALATCLAVGVDVRSTCQGNPPLTPAAFVQLVERYRRGDLESVSEAGRWTPREIARSAKAARMSDQATARAAIVFEIDLARSLPAPDIAFLIEASRSLAQALDTSFNRASEFHREIALCQVACLLRGAEFTKAHWWLLEALRTWPDDPDLLLARGSLYEAAFVRLPREGQLNQIWAQQHESLSLERLANLAVADFVRVVDSATPRVEARLRLGRVLTMREKYAEARPMLERARRDADHSYVRYLASLFTGNLLERMGAKDEAELAYRDAYGQYPAAQAVTLSLARLLIARRADKEADALLLAMFEARHRLVDVPDPWRAYEFGQFWRLEQRLADLRRLVE